MNLTCIRKKKRMVFVIAPCLSVFYLPNIGVASIVEFLRTKGYESAVIDINIELKEKLKSECGFSIFDWTNEDIFYKKIYPLLIENIKRYAEYICSLGLPFVGFPLYQSNNFFVRELAREIRTICPTQRIIVGGPTVSTSNLLQDSLPSALITVAITGFGEYAVYDILRAYEKYGYNYLDYLDVTKKDGYLMYEKRGMFETLPFPKYREFDFSKYDLDYNNKRSVNLLMSRGCRNRCIYCIDWKISPYISLKSNTIVNAMKYHVKKNKVGFFYFTDQAINNNSLELLKTCKKIIRKNLTFLWEANFVIKDDPNNERLIPLMTKAGCFSLIVGLESGSNEILQSMNKHFLINYAAKQIRLMHENGIKVKLNLMVGFPGETDEDFQRTLDFITENKDYITAVTSISPFFLLPGTVIAQLHKKYGIVLPQYHPPIYWYDDKGNTFALRKKRAKKLFQHVQQLGIVIDEENLNLPPEQMGG